MSKPSSLTLALSQTNHEQNGPPTLENGGRQSPIYAAGGIGSSHAQDTQFSTSQPGSQSAPITRRAVTSPLARKPVADYFNSGKAAADGSSPKSTPPALSSSTLDPPTTRHLHPYRYSPGSSVASLSHGNLLETASITSDSVDESAASEPPESDLAFKSSSVPRVGADNTLRPSRKPNKHVFQQFMSRSRSVKKDGSGRRNLPKLNTRGRGLEASRSRERPAAESPLTAPLEPDRGYRDAMNSNLRNHSADRTTAVVDEPHHDQPRPATSRFANLMTSSSKAAGDIGRAGRGFFGKFARTGSHSQDRDNPAIDEHYQLKIINLPLVEQTRLTRIRQKMSDAKDKTEFWLPALPYRCIDFLNLKGCEVEGLYRVPGSVKEIKHWQMRFDMELDVNLLDEPDLDDVNTIGSILKAWLRDQPDTLIPQSMQKRIAEECGPAVAEGHAPQFLKDELSKLPPFNYYLLFAVTAHLALLQKHSDLNKMDFRNLCICFQPCMSIDPVAFHFLVKDWRNCWQGCWPEKEYLEEEYRVMNGDAISPPGDQTNGGSGSGANSAALPTPILGAKDRFPSPEPYQLPTRLKPGPDGTSSSERASARSPPV